MGEPICPLPVKPFVGIISISEEIIPELIPALSERLGDIIIESPLWDFNFTDYYEKEMGKGLKRKFFAFASMMDQGDLADLKHFTNALEKECSQRKGLPRPVNIDPGYLTLAKVVLATTKDYTHRLYIGKNMYAEVTLKYEKGDFQSWPWTYPDYKTDYYREFFKKLRDMYRLELKILEREAIKRGI